MNNPLRWIALVVLLAQVGCARWHGPVPDGLRPVDAAIPRVPPDGPGAPPSDGGGAVAVDVVVADCAATVMEPVCAGVCGNGIVDWCTTACTPCSGGGPDAGMGRCCSTSSEACDGTAPRGQTCLSLGYSGGRLSCGATCRLDTSSCDGCGHDARIASCGRADVSSTIPYALALAATDEAVAIAWITSPSSTSSEGHRLHFARYTPQLALAVEAGCYDVPDPLNVALAPAPGGFVIAADTRDGVYVVPVTADGAPRGTARYVPGARGPMFAERPAAGPLLTYGSARGLFAELLDANGSALWSARVGDGYGDDLGDSVFTGDGFLIAQGATISRVELDGTASATGTFESSSEAPQLEWLGTEGRLTWASFAADTLAMWARIDRNGAIVGPRVALGDPSVYFNRTPLARVDASSDVIAILSGYSGGVDLATALSVVRLDESGRRVYEPYPLTIDPAGARAYRVARSAGRVVVAWIGGGYGVPGFGPGPLSPGRISLALLDP